MRCAITFFVAALVTVSLSSGASAQSKTRDQILGEISSKRSQLSELENQFLAPSADDQKLFADLLNESNTGLIRLLPREKYDSEGSPKARKAILVRGGGAYYSFSKLTHEYGYGSDLSLEQNYLQVGFAGCNYGTIVKLNDISLQELSTDHPVVFSLSRYSAPEDEPTARAEARRFASGGSLDGVVMSERVPLEVNTTYALRSINYDTSDVLVGFRVVRQDVDGSVIIAWKLLQKYPVPKLIRAQSN